MMATLRPHRNVLVELVDELEREAAELDRRARFAVDAGDDGGYFIGAKDATASIAGRLRNLLGAPLSRVVDFAALRDVLVVELDLAAEVSGGTTVTPALAARVAVDLVDGLDVRGARR